MRGYDAWVTREPDWDRDEHVPLHCSACGGFLKDRPDARTVGETLRHCDGKSQTVDCVYTEADRSILDIIGDEFLGESYTVEYEPECGNVPEHEPHDFPAWAWEELHRRCGHCGIDNVEVQA